MGSVGSSGGSEGLSGGLAGRPGGSERAGAQSREVHSFLGVPFAEPPVGARKFKDPEPLPLWTGARQATQFGLWRVLLACRLYLCG